MTVIFLDPGIRTFSGHHTNMVLSLSTALRDRGQSVRVLGHRDLVAEVAEALGAEPTFRLGTYNVIGNDPVCWPLETMLEGAEIISADLRALRPAAGDILVWPTARPSHILATATALGSWPSPLLTVFTAALPCVEPESVYWRFARRRLPPEAHVVFTATAEMMGQDYARVVDRPFLVSPMPHMGAIRNRVGARPVVVGVLGHQRRSKGIHLLPEIVRRTHRDDIRWLVQDSGTDATAILDELETLPNVRVLRVQARNWLNLLDTCDALLLPYDRAEYQRMHSGLVAEAMASGLPIVIPDTPALLSQSEGGGRVVYKGDGVDWVVPAVDALVRNFDSLAAAAFHGAPIYAARHSAGSWADWLLDLAADAGLPAQGGRVAEPSA